MKAHLIRIDAQDAGGSALTLRLSSIDHHALCHQDGATWWPGIARLPALRYDFFGGDFRGAITAPQATFSAAIEGWPGFAGARFASARFRLWSGTLGDDFADFALRFDGLITREPQVERGIATFEAGPDDAWLDKPLLTLFAGSGGLEGPDELEGTAKPLALGTLRFAAGQQIDAVDNVWCVSGHGSVQAVTAVYDRVASLGASSGNYADLASLLAASIPNGSWATCHDEGLVRLGAPPDGKLSFDIEGDDAGAGGFVELPGEVIGRIAELAGGTTDSANLAALDTACPWPLAMDVLSQTTARQAIQEIADSLGAVAGISWTGTLFVQPIVFGTASEQLATDGSSLPPVGEVTAQAVAAPFWRLATRAEPTWVVHDFGEVATGYNYRGEWSATRVYRLDDMVVMPDGRVWVYTAASPSSGNEPADGSAYWSEDLSGGNSNFHTSVPANPKLNDQYFGDGNQPFLFKGTALTFDGEPVTFDGEAITVPGWVSVRDQSLESVIATLQTYDNDGVLTVVEKRSLIQMNRQLTEWYRGIIERAADLGLSSEPVITDAAAAWTAYLAYRDSLTPAWNDTSQPTEFVSDEWDGILDGVYQTFTDADTALTGSTGVEVIPPADQVVLLDSSGAIASGEYPRTLTPTVKRGGVDIRDDDDVTYAKVDSGDIASTINNTQGSADKGKITVTDGKSGSIALTVTVAGIDYDFTIAFGPDAEDDFGFVSGRGYYERRIKRTGDVVLEQWGTATVDGDDTQAVLFPIEFADTTYSVTLSGAEPVDFNDQDNYPNIDMSTKAVTGFTIWNADTGATEVNWRAIGVE